MLKAITVISNNQKELEQKVAPKIKASKQGLVNIFTPHLDHILMLEFRPHLNAPRPFYYNEQPQTRNHWSQPSDSPQFVHRSYVNRPIYQFPTKTTPANLLRQGIVYDSPASSQTRYGSQ